MTSSQETERDKPRIAPIDRNTFEDEFPVMFEFYKERGKLSEDQLQKVLEIQSRWKAGLVFWLTSDNKVIEIPDWVAMNVVINNKSNIIRSSRICMSLNHTKGYGCNRLAEGTCSYIHECVLCGASDHGVFQKKHGALICKRLRKWNEEEDRFKARHGDTTDKEDKLSDLANRGRDPPRQRTSSGAAASDRGSPLHKPDRSPEQTQKVKTLMSTTGCTEQQAIELLVANRWNIQLAADAYYELPEGSSTTTSSTETKPGWGTVWQQVSSSASTISTRSPESKASSAPKQMTAVNSEGASTTLGDTSPHSTEELAPGALDLGPPWEESTISPSPPPSQPPPPRLPPDWQALWSEEHQKYYFWHLPTSTTQWEVPSMDANLSAADTAADSSAASTSSRACGEASAKHPAHRSDGSLSNTSETALSGLPLLSGSLGQLQLGSTEDAPAAAHSKERSMSQQSSALTSSGTPMDRSPPKEMATSEKEKAERERIAEELWSCRDGHYMCTQHWWPPEGQDHCLRLFHGEHVTVTYTDGKDSGWAYGHIIDDSSCLGYFPSAVLKEVKRPPRRRGSGEACSVIERFEAPTAGTGYLTVAPGDVLKVLHPMEAPNVWVYVELQSVSGPQVGWVPEAVLNNAHPAG